MTGAITGAVQTAAEVVNIADKVFTLVRSSEVETMPQLASALPPGVDPNVASRWSGWSITPQTLENTVIYEPKSSLFSDTKFHLGVRFNFGGRADGQPWTYVKDVEAFVVVDSVTILNELDIAVKFASTGTPIDSTKSVMLTGSFNVRLSHKVWGVESSKFFAVRVFGHGGVDILPL
jgi:hypothetical protein